MDRTSAWVAGLALALPWLNPFATGPSSAVLPWLISLVCFCLFVLAIHGRRFDLPQLLSCSWLVAAVISCAIGMLQYFGESLVMVPWINVTPLGEAFANLRQRNQFATLTSIALVAVLWQINNETLQPASREPIARGATWSKDWPTLAVIALALGNGISSSRTGAVQLIMIGGMLWLWGRLAEPRIRHVILIVVLAYALSTLVLPRLAGLDPAAAGILARMRGEGLECSSRLTLWGNVLDLIWRRPWFGWGWGELDYAHFMALYPGPRFCDILDNAHNLPLHLAVELGLPVALAACAVVTWLVWRARPWRETAPDRQLAWAVLALIFLHSMLEYPLWYGPFQIAAGLSVWLLWTTRRPQISSDIGVDSRVDSGEGAPAFSRIRTFVPALAVCILAATAYAGWDYWRVSQIFVPPERRATAYMDNTLQKIQGSWLFSSQVRFAELMTTELRADNAVAVHALALDLLHFSPEARVVEKVIESAVMLGRNDEASTYLARYRAAFPAESARWAKANPTLLPALPQPQKLP